MGCYPTVTLSSRLEPDSVTVDGLLTRLSLCRLVVNQTVSQSGGLYPTVDCRAHVRPDSESLSGRGAAIYTSDIFCFKRALIIS